MPGSSHGGYKEQKEVLFQGGAQDSRAGPSPSRRGPLFPWDLVLQQDPRAGWASGS